MLVTGIVYAEKYISCEKQDLKSDYREQNKVFLPLLMFINTTQKDLSA